MKISYFFLHRETGPSIFDSVGDTAWEYDGNELSFISAACLIGVVIVLRCSDHLHSIDVK